MYDLKQLEFGILMNVSKFKIEALKAALTPGQLAVYAENLKKIKERIIEKNNITDAHLLEVIDREFL